MNAFTPVSVVMATFNGEKFLEKQLNSILTQTRPAAAIIICDDRSTDGTVAILQKYQQRYSIIQYHINASRLGVVNNFKKAVSLCDPSHYIAFSDQDDIWLPEKLEQSVKALTEIDDGESPAFIYSDLIVIDQEDAVLNPSFRNELGHDKYRHNLKTLLFGNFVLGCTVMINVPMRSYLPFIPVSPAFNHDTWIGLIGFSFGKAASLPTSYIWYRKHSTNVTFAGFRRKNRSQRIFGHIKHLFSKSEYLEDQLVLVDLFLKMYHQQLSQEQKKLMQQFLRLKNSSHLKKKLFFERSFKNQWIKRF